MYDKALFRGAGGANYRPDRDRIAAERDRMGKTEKFSQSLEFERDQEDGQSPREGNPPPPLQA